MLTHSVIRYKLDKYRLLEYYINVAGHLLFDIMLLRLLYLYMCYSASRPRIHAKLDTCKIRLEFVYFFRSEINIVKVC